MVCFALCAGGTVPGCLVWCAVTATLGTAISAAASGGTSLVVAAAS